MRGQQQGSSRKPRLKERIRRYFPERQVMVRTGGRISYLRVSSRAQSYAAAALVLFGTWVAYSSVSYVFHDRVLTAKDGQIASVRLAYRSLLREVAEYQKKFTTIARDIEENQGLMLGLVERNATLQQNLNHVESALKATKAEREEILQARDHLKTQLSAVEIDIRAASSRTHSLQSNLSTLETDLHSALGERNQALFETTRMRRHIKELEGKLVDLQDNEEESVQRLTGRTQRNIETMEKVVEIAGLDVKRMLAADKKVPKGQGGPFIPAVQGKPDGLPADRLKTNLNVLDSHIGHMEALQDIMQKLPLAAPLETYYVSSTFGKRRDPINKKLAAHYGVDLGGALNTLVLATAPGVVRYVGWDGQYGRLIEIDHGAGLVTRYGHLNKTNVKKGQEVRFHEQIGHLGNTGRSTGPHLHYEVLFNDKAKDPMRFIRAGRYVFQEQHQE